MTFPKRTAILAALALAHVPLSGQSRAQQLVSLGGVALQIPEGASADLGPSPPPPVGEKREGEDAVEIRWADGRAVTLILKRGGDGLSELPPPSVLGAFDASGVARIRDPWIAARAAPAGGAMRDAIAGLQSGGGLRSYVVRTRNPAYPLARIVCGTGGGSDRSCRLYSRVGEDSVLTGTLPNTDAASVARDVSALVSVLADP